MNRTGPTPWEEFKEFKPFTKVFLLIAILLSLAYFASIAFSATKGVELAQAEHGATYCYTVAHQSVCK